MIRMKRKKIREKKEKKRNPGMNLLLPMAVDETALIFHIQTIYTSKLLSIGLQPHLIDTTKQHLRGDRNTLQFLPIIKRAQSMQKRDRTQLITTTKMSEMRRTQKDLEGHFPMRFHDPSYTVDQTLCRQTEVHWQKVQYCRLTFLG